MIINNNKQKEINVFNDKCGYVYSLKEKQQIILVLFHLTKIE